MATTINGSVVAIGNALNTSRVAQRDTEMSITGFSTGKRINSATDDAAGLNVSSRLRSTIMGLTLGKAIHNVLEFDALLATADHALDQVSNNLQVSGNCLSRARMVHCPTLNARLSMPRQKHSSITSTKS